MDSSVYLIPSGKYRVIGSRYISFDDYLSDVESESPKDINISFYDEMGSRESTLRNQIINAFKGSSNKQNYWKSLNEIAILVGYTKIEVEQAIENSEPNSLFGYFVENRYGEITMRKLYEKYTPSFTKFMHAFQCRID